MKMFHCTEDCESSKADYMRCRVTIRVFPLLLSRFKTLKTHPALEGVPRFYIQLKLLFIITLWWVFFAFFRAFARQLKNINLSCYVERKCITTLQKWPWQWLSCQDVRPLVWMFLMPNIHRRIFGIFLSFIRHVPDVERPLTPTGSSMTWHWLKAPQPTLLSTWTIVVSSHEYFMLICIMKETLPPVYTVCVCVWILSALAPVILCFCFTAPGAVFMLSCCLGAASDHCVYIEIDEAAWI